MPVNYRQRANAWIKSGFTTDETSEFARQYSISQMRSLPYLIRMAKWRRLYCFNLASHGYGAEEIERSIDLLYVKKGWVTSDGQPDAWAMLKAFRTISIANNEYIPKKRAHRATAEITKRELDAQTRQLKIQRDIDKQVGWE